MTATAELIAALVAGGMNAAEAAGLVARAAVEMTGELTRKKPPSSAALRMNEYRNRREAMGMPRVFRAEHFKPMLVARDGARCIYCEATGALVIDHIHPTFLGGTDDHGNLGLACKECNGRKAGKPFQEAGMRIVVRSAEAAHADFLMRTQANTGEHAVARECSHEPRTTANNREHNDSRNCSPVFAVGANNREHVHVPSLSKEEREEVIKKESKRESRATQLPDDWSPASKHWDEAVSILGSPEQGELELRKFKLHAADKGRLAKNWNAAWVKWALQAIEYRARNGNSASTNRSDPVAGRATAREAQHVAQMGGAALRYLQESKAARQVGDLAGGAGTAEIFDFGPRAENAR